MLEQIDGGLTFRPESLNHPWDWEIISDYDGSVLARLHGPRDEAVAKAEELGQSTKEINWTQLVALRKFNDAFKIGG